MRAMSCCCICTGSPLESRHQMGVTRLTKPFSAAGSLWLLVRLVCMLGDTVPEVAFCLPFTDCVAAMCRLCQWSALPSYTHLQSNEDLRVRRLLVQSYYKGITTRHTSWVCHKAVISGWGQLQHPAYTAFAHFMAVNCSALVLKLLSCCQLL